ncbi:hypothetical protein BDW68DRAFT_181419 [Aspergillus falconensis]
MAGIRTKTGVKNVANTPIATKTCKKCSRSWTEDQFRDKRGAPTQLCLQCREASSKSHKRRRERESLKIASEARVEQQFVPAGLIPHPPSVPHVAAPEFQSPNQDTPSRMLNQDLLNDTERNMVAQPAAMPSFTQPAPSYPEIQAPGSVNLRVNPPAPAVPSGIDGGNYEELKAQFMKSTNRENGADMPEVDPQPQPPLLNFEVQSMAVRVERATTTESTAGATRTWGEMPEGTDLAMVAREGEPVSININLVCRFAPRTRGEFEDQVVVMEVALKVVKFANELFVMGGPSAGSSTIHYPWGSRHVMLGEQY